MLKEKLVTEPSVNEKIKTLATKEQIKTLATKAELKAEQEKIMKVQTFESSYFRGKSHLEDDGTHFCLNQYIDALIITKRGLLIIKYPGGGGGS